MKVLIACEELKRSAKRSVRKDTKHIAAIFRCVQAVTLNGIYAMMFWILSMVIPIFTPVTASSILLKHGI